MGSLNQSGKQKVYGKPLQELYAKLIETREAPTSSQLIGLLVKALARQGIRYHPRTVKRQLKGNIEYIPVQLEKVLLEWIQAQSKPEFKKLTKQFLEKKNSIENSEDGSLFVDPRYFVQMAEAYLYLHKNLSRRQLALRLKKSLQENNISIGLETLQSALAGKNQRIRKALEDELVNFFTQEGHGDKYEVQNLIKNIAKEGKKEIEKVAIGDIQSVIDAYLLKSEGVSKRQLAIRVKNRLKEKGYDYHLSSIQSVLEGKTQKTKQVILDSLQELLREEGFENIQEASEYLKSLSPSQQQWYQYVEADQVLPMVRKLLAAHPALSRRRLALALQESLKLKGFQFSLNTLQYVLAGKTRRVRHVILDQLQDYLHGNGLEEFLARNPHTSRVSKGTWIEARVQDLSHQLNRLTDGHRELVFREFLIAREDLIKFRYQKKFSKKVRRTIRRQMDEDHFLPKQENNEKDFEGTENFQELLGDLNRLVG